MAGWASFYPTLLEIKKRVDVRYYAGAAGNWMIRLVFSWLAKLG